MFIKKNKNKNKPECLFEEKNPNQKPKQINLAFLFKQLMLSIVIELNC